MAAHLGLTVVVEVITTAAWVMSVDRSRAGVLRFIVGSAWNDETNRPEFIKAFRKVVTEDEREAVRAAMGVDQSAQAPEEVVAALPDDTRGTWTP